MSARIEQSANRPCPPFSRPPADTREGVPRAGQPLAVVAITHGVARRLTKRGSPANTRTPCRPFPLYWKILPDPRQ